MELCSSQILPRNVERRRCWTIWAGSKYRTALGLQLLCCKVGVLDHVGHHAATCFGIFTFRLQDCLGLRCSWHRWGCDQCMVQLLLMLMMLQLETVECGGSCVHGDRRSIELMSWKRVHGLIVAFHMLDRCLLPVWGVGETCKSRKRLMRVLKVMAICWSILRPWKISISLWSIEDGFWNSQIQSWWRWGWSSL